MSVGPESYDFEQVHTLVKMNLFSRYPRRRAYALSELRQYLGEDGIEADLAEIGEFSVSAIRFSPEEDWYVVGRYLRERPLLEEVPSTEEMACWPRG